MPNVFRFNVFLRLINIIFYVKTGHQSFCGFSKRLKHFLLNQLIRFQTTFLKYNLVLKYFETKG